MDNVYNYECDKILYDAIKEKFEKASHSAIITPHFRRLL